MRIGIDIGNVVIGGSGDDTSFFSDNYLDTPKVPRVSYALGVLNHNPDNELFFISKAGPRTAQKTRDWLYNNALFHKKGIDLDRLVFCRKREQKASIAQLLELDVFIDDRPDICDSMEAVGIRAIQFQTWDLTLTQLGVLD